MNLPRFIRTVRHLKPIQIVYRLWWPVRPVRTGRSPAPGMRPVTGDWVPPVKKQQHMVAPQRFRILNQDIETGSMADWNDTARDKLLLYHLHYMDDLSAENADQRMDWHRAIIDQWIADNPPAGGNGWEPYPLSLRIVNWVKWALAGNELSDSQRRSLWLQARVLNQSVEHHLQANHLIANAKGLYVAGALFDGDEPDTWLKKGTRLLAQQFHRQVLADGGHIERSPMYQSVLLEDLLDIVNVSRTFDVGLPRNVDSLVSPMLHWLDQMTHPDGEPAYFNDAVAGNSAPVSELRRYGARLGWEVELPTGDVFLPMLETGYLRVRRGHMSAFVDVGDIGPDYQPGHAHCDCLSFELSLRDRRIFVNTGVSTYNDDDRRHAERGTAAHNTVSLQGAEQSEIWGAFRVGRRARPFDVSYGDDHVSAAHDGFRRLGVIHRRRIDFSDDGVTVGDTLESAAPASGSAHFHCHPSVEPEIDGDSVCIDGVRLSFDNAHTVDIDDYEYCLGFNDRRSAKKIAVGFESSLTSKIVYEDPLHIG